MSTRFFTPNHLHKLTSEGRVRISKAVRLARWELVPVINEAMAEAANSGHTSTVFALEPHRATYVGVPDRHRWRKELEALLVEDLRMVGLEATVMDPGTIRIGWGPKRQPTERRELDSASGQG